MWQAAMRSGIRDLLPPSANVPEIRGRARAGASLAANGRRRVLRPVTETERYTGRVITVASPKGGVGKTTVATNLAIGLTAVGARSRRCWSTSTCSSATSPRRSSLVPEYTLPDAVRGPASEDTMVLKTFLTQHPSGLYAVCGAESPAAGDTVTRRGRHAGCSRCWRGSSATSSSTPRRGCRSRRWRRSTGPPTS